jgi:sigma-B regulation protein RsbU (phosphoserine phosphatase)
MLSITEKIESLKNIQLFKDVSEDELGKIAEFAQEIQLGDGEILFESGDIGDAIYFILRGQMKAYKSGIELTVLKDNECVGEMAVIDAGPRSASVSSSGNSSLLKLNRNDFYNILQGNINLLQNTLKIILKKLREHTEKEIQAISNQVRMEQDLIRAREMQMSMIPKEDLHISGDGYISIYASGCCYPADKVGGDYYDYFLLPHNQVGIAMGDVMGHGFHTGLLVAMAKSCLQMQIKAEYSIPKIMESMNDMVYEFIEGGLFMTFCYMIFNLKDRTLSFSNAGHPYPYHYCHGKKDLKLMESDVCPLGILKSQDYKVTQVKWDINDVFALYTDGIIEAQDIKDAQFGDDRLKNLVIQNADLPAAKLKETILEDFHSFCQNINQKDDVSLVIIKMGEN